MPIEMPITPGPVSNFVIELDGANYRLQFFWMARMGCYIASILTQDDEPIAVGQRVSVDFPLWANRVDSRLPPGRFIAEDTRPTPAEPLEGELGDVVRVLYFGLGES